MFSSDPMPGEQFESTAEREKALAEKEAIKNGENFNPNLSEEAAEGFENLGDEVPYNGEEVVAEDEEKHDTDNPIAQEFDEQWNKESINLNDVQKSVEYNYANGAIEQATTNADALADYANTKKDATDAMDGSTKGNTNQLHEISKVAASQAISADSLSDNLVDKIKAGDQDAIDQIDEVQERAEAAKQTAEQINAAMMNSSDKEAVMATDVANQAQGKAEEAIAQVNEAKQAYDAMSEDEKEDAQEAEKQAESNGTSFEEELAKLQKNEEDKAKQEAELREAVDNDIKAGIFG